MSTDCKSIVEIQELALLRDESNPRVVLFLQHAQGCERCEFVWGEAKRFQEELVGLLDEEIEPWEQNFINALAGKDSVILSAITAPSLWNEEEGAVTRLAADTGGDDKPRLRELSTYISSSPAVMVRILRDENDKTLHFYLSKKQPAEKNLALYIPERNEPIELDESGHAKLQSDALSKPPHIMILVPLEVD